MAVEKQSRRLYSVGLTLIELLVVIAIIAILSALLFPVFSQAKEAAKTVACGSGVRQVAISDRLYGLDFDDALLPAEAFGVWVSGSGMTYPPGISNGNTGKWPNPEPGSRLAGVWTTIVQPYLKSSDVLFCPSYDERKLKRALDQPFCWGNGLSGSGWSHLGPSHTAAYFPADATTGAGRAGRLADYGISLPGNVYGDGCLYGGHTGTPGSFYCPYYNRAGSGWTLPSGSATDEIWQNLHEGEIANVARSLLLAEGSTQLYTLSPGNPRLVIMSGCQGQNRHKNLGSNYGFVDGHVHYLPVNLERVLDTDSTGAFYVKYMAYDR